MIDSEYGHLPDHGKLRGNYTGERLSTAAAQRAINYLAEALPVSRVARILRMSVHSVMAIRKRRSQDIAERRKRIVDFVGRLATDGLDQINERLTKEKIPTHLLIQITSMCTDKFIRLSRDMDLNVPLAPSRFDEHLSTQIKSTDSSKRAARPV